MIVYIVGPSKGGKTTLLGRVLPGFPSAELLDLDAAEIQRVGVGRSGGPQTGGWNGRWLRDGALLRAAEARPQTNEIFVDVGAGSLQTPEGRHFFIGRGVQAIAVVAPWEVVLPRHPGRDPTEFRATEYSPERLAVYNSATLQVDSSLPIEESEVLFRHALHRLLEGPDRNVRPQPSASA